MSIFLKNVTAVVLYPPSIERTDLRIRNGRIVERNANLTPVNTDDVYDLRDRIVMPGMVNAHTHLYSALSRGMPRPNEPPENFLEILRQVWWKLDRALDEESIYYSALVGAIDAVKCGVTTLADHHASPKSIRGSLDVLKEAMSEVGLRGVLCYEVTDRGGTKERNLGLKENERFIKANRKDTHFRGLVGAHASFTLSNESLRLLGELASEHKTGVHIHVAEDRGDVTDAIENYRSTIVGRLQQCGCLGKHSILAHGVHLNARDLEEIHRSGSWLVHNPRSNMNNRVGYAPTSLFGDRTALGTDGFPADMFEEAKLGFYKMQDERSAIHDGGIVRFVQGGQTMLSEIFGQKFGTLEPGAVADLIVLDYQPPTPITIDNLAEHFLFGMNSSVVDSVMIDGRWVMKNRIIIGVDVARVYEKSSRVAKRLWRRIERHA